MAKKMRAVQIPKAKGPLEVVEREIPEPKSGSVRVKNEAYGLFHSDS
jgi:D-arabinose 1-dehydrogenase-like Zn-dependent alcohol dehydrogenase